MLFLLMKQNKFTFILGSTVVRNVSMFELNNDVIKVVRTEKQPKISPGTSISLVSKHIPITKGYMEFHFKKSETNLIIYKQCYNYYRFVSNETFVQVDKNKT